MDATEGSNCVTTIAKDDSTSVAFTSGYDLDLMTSDGPGTPVVDLQTWVYTVFLVLSTLAGNIGNTMVIGAMLSDKRLWKEANIFILNLALADLCVTGQFTHSSKSWMHFSF